jgi:hypothetical protein
MELGLPFDDLVPQSWVVRNVLFPLIPIESQEHLERVFVTGRGADWERLRADIRDIIDKVNEFARFMIVAGGVWLSYLLRPWPTISFDILLADLRSPTPYVFTSLFFSGLAIISSMIWHRALVTLPVTLLQRHCDRLVTYIAFFFSPAFPTLSSLVATTCLALGVAVGVLFSDSLTLTIISLVCCVVLPVIFLVSKYVLHWL